MSLCIEMNWPIRTVLKPTIGEKVLCALRQQNLCPQFVSTLGGNIRVRGMFGCRNRILDEVRYRVTSVNGCLTIEKLAAASPTSDEPTLLIMLESPHQEEYVARTMRPIGPAQGNTGRVICRHLAEILRKSWDMGVVPDGTRVIIANPVPFQTSLHAVHGADLAGPFSRLRDAVWASIWAVPEVRCAFRQNVERHAPTWIVNACTGGTDGWSGLKGQISDWVNESGMGDRLYNAPHPARNGWCVNTRFTKLHRVDVNCAPKASMKRSLIGVGPKLAHRIVEARPIAQLCCLREVAKIGDWVLKKNRWRMTIGANMASLATGCDER